MSFSAAFTFENEAELKEAFARLFLRYGDEFKAALELFPGDVPRALWVAMNWKHDNAVTICKSQIQEDDEFAMLPSKYDAALAVWKIFEDDKLSAFERLGAWDRYAAIRGFIEKPGSGVTVNVNENRVMLVTDHGSNDTWQDKMRAQQELLTSTKFIDGNVAAN